MLMLAYLLVFAFHIPLPGDPTAHWALFFLAIADFLVMVAELFLRTFHAVVSLASFDW